MAGDDAGEWPTAELPTAWRWVDFATFFSDFTDSHRKVPQKDYKQDGTLAVVDQGAMRIGGYTDDLLMQSTVPLPAVVFGDHTRAVKYIDLPFAQGADGVRVLAPSPHIEPRFAYQALLCLRLPNKGYSRHFKFLKASPFPLPPRAEQRRIVAKIDGLSDKSKRARDHLHHIPRLAEKYKQAVLGAAFQGELIRAGQTDEGSTWRAVSVGDIAVELFDGPFGSNLKSSDYTDEGIRVVRLENIGHLTFVKEKRTYISQAKFAGLKRHMLHQDDVLVSSFVADEMRVCRFPPGLDAPAINKADCFCVRPDIEIVLPRFLELRLGSSATFKALENEVHGATRPRISLSQLRNLRLDLPSLEEQARLVRSIETAFTWIDRLASEASTAFRLLDRLDYAVLAKAFRGELVPQDPGDEPAHVLLDRIKAERATSPRPKRGRKVTA